ncbi:DUF6187 family protein [Amycolatopsis nigrescens]|uniref:DUF6187 family protein n=1 Tax=Amycolatopsis nigrescens TaxID=381445 RepID=UPI000361F150|nr:DUF6187 family protein [Amycolatopsis nigrescens]
MASGEHDTRFSLPAVDAPASTEVGVILLGLDAERLLAGLGLATLADDPGLVALAVDQVRHGALTQFTQEGLVEAGATRWRCLRSTLGAPDAAGSLRQTWERAIRSLTHSDGPAPGPGPASAAYLAACWLRREDIDRFADHR